jgi:hypothetical protein
MRPTSLIRSVILGAAGFGVLWVLLGVFARALAIAGGVGLVLGGAFFSGDLLTFLVYALVFSVGGACGGAVLGLGLRDRGKAPLLALMGAVGFLFGSFIVVGLFFSSFFRAGYGFLEVVSAAAFGLVVGAALGLALRSWRGTAVLALVGFGIGGVIAAASQGFPLQPSGLPLLQSAAFGAIEGLIGGASLGAALGYLERRRLIAERRLRVR